MRPPIHSRTDQRAYERVTEYDSDPKINKFLVGPLAQISHFETRHTRRPATCGPRRSRVALVLI